MHTLIQLNYLSCSSRVHYEPDPAHLDAHHELGGCALVAVEEPCPLEPDVDIVQVQVLPLCVALTQEGGQLKDIRPGGVTSLLNLDL